MRKILNNITAVLTQFWPQEALKTHKVENKIYTVKNKRVLGVAGYNVIHRVQDEAR